VALSAAHGALGDRPASDQARHVAIGLTEDPAIRAFLAMSVPSAPGTEPAEG